MASPRPDMFKGAMVASLTDIKAELLGSEMRRLIREELCEAFKERDGPGRRAVSLGPDLAGVGQPDAGPLPHREGMHKSPSFLEGAEGMLGLNDKEDMEWLDEASQQADSHKASHKTNPLNFLDKSVISMLEVTALEKATKWDFFMLRVQRRLNVLGTLNPPPRNDCLSRIADSVLFDVAVHMIILINIFCMAFQADYEVQRGQNDVKFFDTMEAVFLAFYAFEFVVKLGRYRLLYFYGKGYGWNWVDFLVLIFSIPFVLQIEGAMDALPGKIIRVLRLTRALRVLQLVTFFKKLKALLHSLAASVSTLICSLSMLVVFLFMFSLFFVMRVAQVLHDGVSDITPTQREQLLGSFGSIVLSMLTLFEAGTGGRDWSDTFAVLESAGWESQVIFVGFIAFAQMALLNIVLGMFVEEAMKAMSSDKLEMAHRHFAEQSEFRDHIQDIFRASGMADGNTVSPNEWRISKSKHRLYSYLDFYGFQPNEVDQYFELLSNSSPGGNVDINHFVNGCIRMKGGASSFSVYEVLLAVSELEEKLQTHLDQVQSQLRLREQPPTRASSSRSTLNPEPRARQSPSPPRPSRTARRLTQGAFPEDLADSVANK